MIKADLTCDKSSAKADYLKEFQNSVTHAPLHFTSLRSARLPEPVKICKQIFAFLKFDTPTLRCLYSHSANALPICAFCKPTDLPFVQLYHKGFFGLFANSFADISILFGKPYNLMIMAYFEALTEHS